ncbi:MAG: IclR family transcriptional regulator [bacterium]|nr:IclR family transcriptional regulator [bacterium]
MSSRTLSSVRNAARLLKAISAHGPEMGITELSQRLDLGKSTVHRLVTTLAEEQLLVKDPATARYRLGLAMYDLGNTAVNGLNLHSALSPAMNWLQDVTGGTVHAGVLDHREVIYVERLESPNMLRLFIEIGRRQPAHSNSSGKCLLAFLDRAELDKVLDGWVLVPKTVNTITDLSELRRQLTEIRRNGYALNEGESELEVLSIAAPVRDRKGSVVAAISLAGEESQLRGKLSTLIPAVRQAGAVASHQLGYQK